MSASSYKEFVAAGYNGNEAYLLQNLGKVPIDCEDENGDNALISATLADRLPIVRFLLSHKANVNHANKYGFTALHWAADHNNTAILQTLIDNKANIHQKEAEGYTAFAVASKAGANDTVKLLLQYNVNIEDCNNRGDTALLLAACRGRDDVVSTLLAHRANPNIGNREGATPLLMASWCGSMASAKSLVYAKADINYRTTQRGDTALLLAAYRGHVDLVEWLTSQGARDDIINNKGTSVHSFQKAHITDAVNRGKQAYANRYKKPSSSYGATPEPSVSRNSSEDPEQPMYAPKVERTPMKSPARAPASVAVPQPQPVVPKQPSQRANMSPIEAFMEEEFSKIIGMDSVKNQLRAFYKKVQLDKIREKQLGKKVEKNRLYHMIFMGPPGTGKTTMANLTAKVMLKMQLLKNENVVMVNNPLDLIAGYVGQTPGKVDAKVKEAEGGVLFIDEAYSIVKKDGKDQFGREAIDTIMKHLDPPSCVFILAGYERQMNEFLDMNEGLTRRIPYRYHFHPYTPKQLGDILVAICKSKDEDLEPGCVEACIQMIEKHLTVQQRESQNAGLVNNWVAFAQVERDDRLDIEEARRNPDLASLMLTIDFERALPALKNMAQK